MNRTDYERIGETALRETLPNGLHLCIVPKPEHVRKYAFFATHYGGMDVRFQLDGQWLDTPAGIAHYLEHKMFDTKEGNALQELAKNGAEPNAFTSNTITGYYFSSTEHFMENLRILLSFVSTPYFTEESVSKERGIISQEICMVEDDPGWQIYDRMLQALYQKSAARISVAGSVESIREITAQTLYDCHRAFYTPSNMALTVVGNVEPEAIRDLAMEILPAEGGPVIPRDYGEEPPEVAARETSLTMPVSLPQFLLGFKCTPMPDGPQNIRRSLIAELAAELLAGISSPLYQRLYEQGLINGTFDIAFDTMPGVAYLYAGGESRDPDAVAAALLEEADRLGREGIPDEFYQRMRRVSFSGSLRGMNSFEAIASSCTHGCFLGYDPFRFPEIYDSVQREDVEDFLRSSVREDRSVMSRILPETP